MIIGKNSIWKMLALFLIVLVAVLDLIFCAQCKTVMWINGILVSSLLGFAAVALYKKWENDGN